MGWERLTQTWHYVEKWAAAKPQIEVMAFENERLTWADFKVRTDWIAQALLEIGVEKGDRIAMLSAARNEFLTTFMAAGKVGAVWIGLSPKFTLDELRYLLGDSQPKVLIAVREFMGSDLAPVIETLMQEFSCIKKALIIGDAFGKAEKLDEFAYRQRSERDAELLKRASEVGDLDPTLLLYTSGSTGKPKG